MPTSKLSTTNKKALILGAGYLGQRLISPLHESGYLVDTVTRNSELDSQKIHQQHKTSQKSIADIFSESKPDLVIICWAPGSRGGDPSDYEKTYWNSLLDVKEAIQTQHTPGQVIYTSSTSVYQNQDGQLKNEAQLSPPQHDRGQVLFKAEQEVLSWSQNFNLSSKVLRCSGIIGPDRSPGLRLIKSRDQLPGNGLAWVNLIHVDDIVLAIQNALTYLESGLWNLNAMCLRRKDLYRFMAEQHELSCPPWESLSEENIGRRIDAQLVKDQLNWDPQYKTLEDLSF